MPVVVLQHGGHATVSSSSRGPNSHLLLSIFVFLCVNPPFGLVGLIFSILSRVVANQDYEAARIRGRIAMFVDITGIVITVITVLILVLIFYTRDS